MSSSVAARPTSQAAASLEESIPGRAFLFGLALATVATTFMLQSMRVFVSYMVFVIDQSNREMLAITALSVFAAIGLAGVVIRVAGVSGTLLATGIGLLAARMTYQFWALPEARLYLGATAIICWGWLSVALLTTQRAAIALGVACGIGLDLAIRIAFGTVDLPWIPSLATHTATVLLGVIMLVATIGSFWQVWGTSARGPRFGFAVPLVSIGPGIALYHLLTGNLGLGQVQLAAGFPMTAGIVAFGAALGVLGSSLLIGNRTVIGHVIVIAAVGGIGLWLFWERSDLAPLGLIVGLAGNIMLLTIVLMVDSHPAQHPGAGVTTFWFTIGMITQVAILFTYYSFSGSPPVILVGGAIFVFGAMVAGILTHSSSQPSRRVTTPTGLIPLILFVVAGVQFIFWSTPQAGPPLRSNLTVMTYNLQTGFDINNAFDLEAQARTIEAADPDILAVQEITRGWLVTSGFDQVLWLSRRLDMPYTFGTNSDDGIWGNAIFTRAPVTTSETRQYDQTQNLKRGVIGIQIQTEADGLWVFGTHLDNPHGAGEIRLEQVDQLLDYWDGRSPALLMGDFNAEPDDAVIIQTANAGFRDPGEILGSDAFTSQDARRIDYILTTPNIEVDEIWIPQVWTSDHLPVVANIRLTP